MGTYANFLIEYKDDAGWHQVKGYRPFREWRYTEWTEDGTPVEKVSVPDNELKTGEKVDMTGPVSCQGHVRDVFSRSMFDGRFEDRGLPDDVSDEVRRKISEAGEHWGETYADVSEISDLVKEKLGKFFTGYDGKMTDKFLNMVLARQIKAISDDLFGKKVLNGTVGDPDAGDGSGYADDDLDYMREEEIWDILELWGFHESVKSIVEFMGIYGDVPLRVICWLD